MDAVVLVGGFGTRLRPLTLSTPKQMLPVGDRSMLEWVVGNLGERGIDRVVLALGYRPDVFLAAHPDGTCAGVPLHYAVEPEPLGTAGAIRFAAASAGIDGTFVVVNGDVLTDLDVAAMVEAHRSTAATGTLALHAVGDPSAFGVVDLAGDGRVRAFVEKPAAGREPSNLINAGTYVLEPDVLDLIPDGRAVSIEREIFPDLALDGRLRGVVDDGYWLDTGTPMLLLQANLDALDGCRKVPVTGVAGAVDDGAIVRRSVVCEGAQVAVGAEVVDSVVMGGTCVEAGAVVDGSLVGRDAVIGRGARLDSLCVIGDGEHVEPGARLSGVRVPEPS